MTRVENSRKEIIESGSPLSRHSTNQHQIKAALEGQRKLFPEPRKARRADEKRTRTLVEFGQYSEAKLQRVLERVQAVKLGGFDGYCETGFCHEVRFLRANGLQLN